ncbi:MAG: ATP-binding cassette domain-containing protein [Thermoleophilaceae bacterium]|nr:ATP-binding cassette domain-containing protein [Thermoleophilaceae bacterium]
MATVEIRDLQKRFGSVPAVNGLTFDVEAGRVTGFLGPNGAGKSTTLRALLGLVRPTAGSATLRRARLRRARAADHPGRRRARGHRLPPRPHRAQSPPCPGHRGRAPANPGSTRCWPRWASPKPPTAAQRATRWACVSAWP